MSWLVTLSISKSCLRLRSRFTMRFKSWLSLWTRVSKAWWSETFHLPFWLKFKSRLGSMSRSVRRCPRKLPNFLRKTKRSSISCRHISKLTTWTKTKDWQTSTSAICRATIMHITTLKTLWWPSTTKIGKTEFSLSKRLTTTLRSTQRVEKLSLWSFKTQIICRNLWIWTLPK